MYLLLLLSSLLLLSFATMTAASMLVFMLFMAGVISLTVTLPLRCR